MSDLNLGSAAGIMAVQDRTSSYKYTPLRLGRVSPIAQNLTRTAPRRTLFLLLFHSSKQRLCPFIDSLSFILLWEEQYREGDVEGGVSMSQREDRERRADRFGAAVVIFACTQPTLVGAALS